MTKRNVFFVSPDGEDGAAGTAKQPMSLSHALYKARPGTRIVLKAGKYPPIVLEGLRGTAARPIVIRAEKAPALDLKPLAKIDKNVYVRAIRRNLDAGKFAITDTDGLAVIGGRRAAVGVMIRDCRHVRVEGLVVRDAYTGIQLQRCKHVTLSGGVVFGDPAVAYYGVTLHRDNMDEEPSSRLHFERMVAYGLKENGFGVHPAAAFDCTWDCCLAHSMQSSGGDGFCFSHVSETPDKQSPCRVYKDGIDYRFRLVRCAAVRNRLDGFDIGDGVGGVELEFCLGDGNGWGAYFAKDIKVWSSNNTLIRTRMTGRILFVNGVNRLENFKTGVAEDGPDERQAVKADEALAAQLRRRQ